MCRSMIAALMCLLPMTAVAQTAGQQASDSVCSAAMARSLTIRGIHLGMSADEVLALFPGASERAEIKAALAKTQNSHAPDYGTADLYFKSFDYSGLERFKDVEYFDLRLFDGWVAGLIVHYVGSGQGPYWPTVDDWVAKLSEAFRLPGPTEWQSKAESPEVRRLQCGLYTIEASLYNGDPAITVFDLSFTREVQARVKATQEKKRREFKP